MRVNKHIRFVAERAKMLDKLIEARQLLSDPEIPPMVKDLARDQIELISIKLEKLYETIH